MRWQGCKGIADHRLLRLRCGTFRLLLALLLLLLQALLQFLLALQSASFFKRRIWRRRWQALCAGGTYRTEHRNQDRQRKVSGKRGFHEHF